MTGWHQLHHKQIICTSFQTDNHASTSPLTIFRPDALPAAQPTALNHWRHNMHTSMHMKQFTRNTPRQTEWTVFWAEVGGILPKIITAGIVRNFCELYNVMMFCICQTVRRENSSVFTKALVAVSKGVQAVKLDPIRIVHFLTIYVDLHNGH